MKHNYLCLGLQLRLTAASSIYMYVCEPICPPAYLSSDLSGWLAGWAFYDGRLSGSALLAQANCIGRVWLELDRECGERMKRGESIYQARLGGANTRDVWTPGWLIYWGPYCYKYSSQSYYAYWGKPGRAKSRLD